MRQFTHIVSRCDEGKYTVAPGSVYFFRLGKHRPEGKHGNPQQGGMLVRGTDMGEKNPSVVADFDLKSRIFDALDELVAQKSFDKVSVTEICTAANVSRATFYRHFSDKYSIPQWYMDLAYSQGTNEIGRTLSWREGYYITEARFAQHRGFFQRAAQSNDYNAVDNYAPRERKKVLTETLVKYHGKALTERMKFQIDATVELECHLLPRWHYGEYNVTLEEICSWMTEIVPRELFKVLNTPIKPSTPEKRFR